MYNTQTNTSTYTKVDIKKTFEGFEADLRMIARRTAKWSMTTVDNVFHDIIALAEEGYIHSVDIVLQDSYGSVIRASKYVVNSDGTSLSSDRAGGNDWTDIPNSQLTVILMYTSKWHNMSPNSQLQFEKDKNFKSEWVSSHIDNSFPHLTKSSGQLYASNGYELQKTVYK